MSLTKKGVTLLGLRKKKIYVRVIEENFQIFIHLN